MLNGIVVCFDHRLNGEAEALERVMCCGDEKSAAVWGADMPFGLPGLTHYS